MTSSSRERTQQPRPGEPTTRGDLAARYDVYLDGLFTYCLSVMCEHTAAHAALGEALAIAERRTVRRRQPSGPDTQRSWLYALARWCCLRRLGGRQAGGAPAATDPAGGRAGAGPPGPRPVPWAAGGVGAEQRRRELAALAWPEAAGADPEQREALELAVRHQLAVTEVARVLRLTPDRARALLTAAAREVERARGALAAVRAADCPVVGPLAGGDQLLLAPGLRRELMAHVDDCLPCRHAARAALAGGSWRGGAAPPGAERLAVLPAPREAVHAARVVAARARSQQLPRFDRSGFPLPAKDRAARRERFRRQAVTTTVVATVVAAPALALWAVYRSAPLGGESDRGAAPAAADDDRNGEGYYDHPYENAGRAGDSAGEEPADPEPEADGGTARPDGTADPPDAEPDSGDGAGAGDGGSDSGSGGDPAGGKLRMEAAPTESGTQLTVTATGDASVRWRVSVDVPWLTLSQSAGTLRPGERVVIMVTVDRDREPAEAWRGRVTVEPSGGAVTIEGSGSGVSPDPTDPGPEDPADPVPEPTDPEPDPADPGPDPTDPEPEAGEDQRTSIRARALPGGVPSEADRLT